MSFLSWWKPKCSAGFREKAWVETKMRWLGEQLGMERLTRCEVILPTEDYFPDAYDATPDAAGQLLDRVCDYMQVSRANVALRIYSKDDMPPVAGTYEPGVIHVADVWLDDPLALVASLACWLAFHILMGRGLLKGARDSEYTTELTTVYFGLGIFVANAAVGELHGHRGATVRKQGYLPSRVLAYALALHAWLRGDTQPDWVGHLRLDAATAFREGLRYLARSEDSLLRPDNLRQPDATSIDGLVRQLERAAPSDCVAALWELARRATEADKAVPAIMHCLANVRKGIRAEAARTLAESGPSAANAVQALIYALDDSEEEVRAAAAFALGKLRLQPETVIESLTNQLDDSSTLATVAWGLAQFGADARPALPQLLNYLGGELGRCTTTIDYLVYAVRAIAPDPEAEIRQLVDSCDPDLRQQAEHLLPESGPITSPPGGAGWWPWADGSS